MARPGPRRAASRSSNGQDSSPEVPPELQRVGLRFLLTGVQQRLFEMACDLLETRNRALRCGEDLLEEMCRMVLGTAGSSTSENVVNPRCLPGPRHGRRLGGDGLGPIRVGREDVERAAAILSLATRDGMGDGGSGKFRSRWCVAVRTGSLGTLSLIHI